MRYLAAVLAVLLNVALASAQTVPWQPLPNSIMADHYPVPIPQGNNGPSSIVGAWNSAAFDTLRNQLIIAAAGGHGDYAGNEVYAFQHATQSWVRLTDPTPCLTLPSAWNYPSGDYSCDGTSIVSRHTYGGVSYEPLRDCVWMSGGSRWHDSGPTEMSWCFHLATNTWEKLGVTMGGYFLGMPLSFQSAGNPYLEWDAGSGRLITTMRWVISAIDEGTNTAVPLACSGDRQGPYGGWSAAIDPATRMFYMLGNGHLRAIDLSVSHLPLPADCANGPVAQDVVLATTGAKEIETLNVNNPKIDGFAGTGLVWDVVTRKLVAYGETGDKLNGRVYTFDPTTKQWTAWEATGTPPPHPTGTGVWHKLWFANDGCLYVVTDGSKPVYQACNLPWRGATTYQVRTDTNGTGNGIVQGAGFYSAGVTVSLSAMANSGSVFSGWSGDAICASGSFTMPAAAVSCVATFTLTSPPVLVLNTAGGGSGSVLGAGTYASGAQVTIQAFPAAGSAFSGWTGDPLCPTATTPIITMPATGTVTCTANFVPAVCQGPSPPLAMTFTPILRPIRSTGVPHPDPAESSTYGGQMKHARFAYNALTGESLLTGGDHGGSGPGGVVGDGNFQPTVWAANRDGTSWRLLSPGCPAAGIYPARPDNVVWAIDTKRNRGVIWPGFFGGIAKALSECANPNPQMDALLFDLTANAWGPVPWAPPNPPNPANSSQYWGDNGMTWGVYDSVTDSIYGYSWTGSWGGVLVSLNIASGTWTRRNLGEQTATQPYNDDLRNSYSARMQPALDVQGRALYLMTGFTKRLYRVRLDVPDHRGEWVSALPAQCVGRDDDSMEGYSVFDSDHRAVLIFCVPNLGGEVIGVAAYFVDPGTWAYYPAPITLPYAVMANAFVYSPSCRCVIATGGHGIFTENPARPNPAPNPFSGTVPPGNQQLPDPRVDWTIQLS